MAIPFLEGGQMSKTYLIPLSLPARFLATQLSSVASKPRVVLPPHLMKAFLTAESRITYINKISPNNLFECSHLFSCSSFKFFEKIFRPVGVPIDSGLNNNSIATPISLITPASQLNLLLDPDSCDSAILPPPKSTIIVVNPYYGQVEKFMSRISFNYQINERPRVWVVVCTHQLTNGPLWSVEHRSIGEMKIAYVPYESSNLDLNMDRIINDSKVIKDILNTHTLLPQVETYDQINQLLIDQLILEAALAPIIYSFYEDVDGLLNDSVKALSNRIIEEAVEVISHDNLFINLSFKSAAFGAGLSTRRFLKKTESILQNNNDIIQMYANQNTNEETLKMRKKNKQEYGRINRGEKNVKISRMRDPAKANRYLKNLGFQNGLKTPANSQVLTLLTPDYDLTKENVVNEEQ